MREIFSVQWRLGVADGGFSAGFKNKYFYTRSARERKIGWFVWRVTLLLSSRYAVTHDGGCPLSALYLDATISANRFTPTDRGKSVSFRVARSTLIPLDVCARKSPDFQCGRYFSNSFCVLQFLRSIAPIYFRYY